MTERTLGGQLCEVILCGASQQVEQVPIQMLVIEPPGIVARPYAFVVMSRDQAEQFYNDLGLAIAQIKRQVQ